VNAFPGGEGDLGPARALSAAGTDVVPTDRASPLAQQHLRF
jgi:hypothetical protein